jgi:hypothetical protein
MTMDDRLAWSKPDIALRRAPFILSDEMKLRAERTLRLAADAIRKSGEESKRL